MQAVHLGIVFVYYGLVRIPSKPNNNIYNICKFILGTKILIEDTNKLF